MFYLIYEQEDFTMAKDKDFEQLPPEDRLGGAPVESRYKELITGIMRTVDGLLNGEDCLPGEKQTGIVMLFFPYGDREGRTNYISNGANRADVVRLMEEQIRRFKTDSDDGRLTIEQMAKAIQEICVDGEGKSLVNETMAIAAAATCLIIYRRGPENIVSNDKSVQPS